MRKVDDGEKKRKEEEKKKIMTFIVATTSLPVDRPNADRLERRTLVPKFPPKGFLSLKHCLLIHI